MNPTPALGLPAAIEAAVRRVKLAARHAAERTVDSLGVSALASANVFQRDALLGAQFELNRKLALFCNGFDETLDRRIERELLPRHSTQQVLAETSWDALSLVDNHEMEVQVSAERLGLQIAQDCEAEQRELEGFVGSALQGFGAAPRNPLRPEIIGNAMIRSVDQVTDRADQRKVLVAELGRSMAASLGETYAAIVADMRAAGSRCRHPVSAVRSVAAASAAPAPATTPRAGRSVWMTPELRHMFPRARAAIPGTAAGRVTRLGRRSVRGCKAAGMAARARRHRARHWARSTPG
jgi:hypothetical protein